MCRLLGYVAAEPISVLEVLGAEGLEAFTSLTVVHDDGWGMAWHDAEDPATVRRASAPHSAASDPVYDDLVRQPLGPAGLVHLRWATGGLPISPENTHPFVDGGYAFAHNGHVAPIRRLDGLLRPAARERLLGQTDSERFFRFILQCIEDAGGDEVSGVGDAVGTLRSEFPEASLNSLLLTPSRMFAVHINSHAQAPPALRELFPGGEHLPVGHADEEYFEMTYHLGPDSVHVVSSGLGDDDYLPVPEDMAVVVDLATRARTRLELG